MADVRFRPNPQGVAAILRGPNGLVARRAIEDATLVKREAQRLVGVGPDVDDRPHLRDTIVTRITVAGDRVVAHVGSDALHALFHHEGTRPHEIRPTRAKVLRFTVGGAVVFATKVDHPGTKPNRFLVNALRVLRGRY